MGLLLLLLFLQAHVQACRYKGVLRVPEDESHRSLLEFSSHNRLI
jgi:hypothetical protein